VQVTGGWGGLIACTQLTFSQRRGAPDINSSARLAVRSPFSGTSDSAFLTVWVAG
jgi:hypothetical protein